MDGGWDEAFLLLEDDARELSVEQLLQICRPADDVAQNLGEMVDLGRILLKVTLGVFERDQVENRAMTI